MKEKTFLVIYQTETDGEIYIDRMTTIEIMSKFKNSPDDYFAIIEGEVIKSFNKKFSEFLG